MTIFAILAIYLIVIQNAVPESNKTRKSAMAAFGLLLILALRSPYCGLDVTGSRDMIRASSYGGLFLSMPLVSYAEILRDLVSVGGHYEIGWVLLTKTISLFTNSLQVYLIIIAIIQVVPLAYIIGKYSSNIVLSYFVFICLGFYIDYFSGLRQMTAVSLTLLSFDQILQKHYFKFVVIVLLAYLIHSSAIMFLLVWPLSKIRLSFSNSLKYLGIIVALMPLYRIFISNTLTLLFESRYERYLDSQDSAITMFIVYAVFLLISYINKDDSPKLNFFRILVLIGVAGQSLGVLGDNAITRIGYYFNVYLMLLLPEVLTSFRDKTERGSIIVVSVVLLCLFFVLTTNEQSSYGVIPYEFFWEDSRI